MNLRIYIKRRYQNKGESIINRRLLKIVIPVLLLICASSYYLIQYSRKTFSDLLGTNETNITRVSMRNGANGNIVETTDKEKIKEIISLVNDRYYKKSSNQSPSTGYSYFYDFYSGDKQVVRITGNGDYVEVNDKYYDVSKPIPLDSLAAWYNSLLVKN